jgi:hypothetical protein
MAKDKYHEAVRNALIKDGWTITHDPFILKKKEAKIDYEVDLGAEKLLAAEKGVEKIAVEIKSFLKTSLLNEFHGILGQYISYTDAIEYLELDRPLILAIPEVAEARLQDHPFILHLIKKHQVKTLVYNEDEEIILSWKK